MPEDCSDLHVPRPLHRKLFNQLLLNTSQPLEPGLFQFNVPCLSCKLNSVCFILWSGLLSSVPRPLSNCTEQCSGNIVFTSDLVKGHVVTISSLF
jgi:hypothetical protein